MEDKLFCNFVEFGNKLHKNKVNAKLLLKCDVILLLSQEELRASTSKLSSEGRSKNWIKQNGNSSSTSNRRRSKSLERSDRAKTKAEKELHQSIQKFELKRNLVMKVSFGSVSG